MSFLHTLELNTFLDKYTTLDIDNLCSNLIVSKDKYDNILSYYEDDIWDLSPYCLETAKHNKIHFKHLPQQCNIYNEGKKLTLLVLYFKSGRYTSSCSVLTIDYIFKYAIIPFCKFAYEKQISLFKLLSDNKLLHEIVDKTPDNKMKGFSQLLSLLKDLDNTFTKINYLNDPYLIEKILTKKRFFDSNTEQTLIIPSRILGECIRQQIQQINEIMQYSDSISQFLHDIFKNRYHATKRNKPFKSINGQIVQNWEEAINTLNLQNLFTKYNIQQKQNFFSFISKIQGTCKSLIHSYSGMRDSEVLNLTNNCLEKDSEYVRLLSITTKLEGKPTHTKWITSEKIEPVIKLLNIINKVIAQHYGIDFHTMPLFVKKETYSKYTIDINKISANSHH